MKILIVGTGGVGGYFGAKLARSGNEVTFIARGAHLQAIKKNGLSIKSVDGDFRLPKVKATEKISEVGLHDVIILATKTWQVKEVAAQLGPAMHKETMVVPLQNGVMAREELLEFVPEKNIVEGLCQIISKIEAPGVINHFAIAPKIIIGEYDGTISERAVQLQAVFTEAGLNIKVSDQIQTELWKKFILICVGGLVAVCRSTYGGVRSNPQSRQLMIEVLSEGYRLSQAVGIPVPSTIIGEWVAFIDSFPYEATSSLCRDIWEGRPSEIEYKNGSVVKLGQRYGVSTPANRFVYYALMPLEIEARKRLNL